MILIWTSLTHHIFTKERAHVDQGTGKGALQCFWLLQKAAQEAAAAAATAADLQMTHPDASLRMRKEGSDGPNVLARGHVWGKQVSDCQRWNAANSEKIKSRHALIGSEIGKPMEVLDLETVIEPMFTSNYSNTSATQ